MPTSSTSSISLGYVCVCYAYIHTTYDPINVAHMYTSIEFTTWALGWATYQGPFLERNLTLPPLATVAH